MAYIGTPPSNAFTSLLKQDFSTSATTGYTLDHAVNNANDIALFINFVRQEPTAAYSASGTTLTLTSATASSDDMYCVYLGQAVQTVNPPNASVGASQIVDASITSGKLASGVLPTNTPAFSVSTSGSTTTSSGAYTVIQYNTKEFDTDTKFNTSGYYYEIPTTGKYQINIQMRASNQNNAQYYYGIALYKDTSSGFGSETQIAFQRYLSGYGNHSYSPEVNHHLVDCMSFTAGEFLRTKWYISGGNGGTVYGNDSGQPRSSTWSMTKLIG